MITLERILGQYYAIMFSEDEDDSQTIANTLALTEELIDGLVITDPVSLGKAYDEWSSERAHSDKTSWRVLEGEMTQLYRDNPALIPAWVMRRAIMSRRIKSTNALKGPVFDRFSALFYLVVCGKFQPVTPPVASR